ncbi:MAG: pyridoxamine 5'-phosphate oxidase family protein [bacterium]|nr:pyridoxamine 5'-phosphate oxidase family protein [bacterium]
MTQPAGTSASSQLLPHDCWALMSTVHVGRLGFSTNDEQEIFPLNFIADHGSIVFRTSNSTRIMQCLDGRAVAFEADHVGADEAWSVVAKGTAAAVTGLYENLDVAELPVHPLQSGSKPIFVRILVDTISGRRFVPIDTRVWTPSELTGRHLSSE